MSLKELSSVKFVNFFAVKWVSWYVCYETFENSCYPYPPKFTFTSIFSFLFSPSSLCSFSLLKRFSPINDEHSFTFFSDQILSASFAPKGFSHRELGNVDIRFSFIRGNTISKYLRFSYRSFLLGKNNKHDSSRFILQTPN